MGSKGALPKAYTTNLLPQVTRDVMKILFPPTMKGTCDPPPKSRYTVGLDGQLITLKARLLEKSVSVLLLTGLPGSGKTTLAVELCWDPEIQGTFRENIFFFTFSKNPNLKRIVQTLFNHCVYETPEFLSDEEALNRMVTLLKRDMKCPKLLVLDDVWPVSEPLIGKLQEKLQDCCKILVTSRFIYPQFGTVYHVESLSYEDALMLFNHLAQLNVSSLYRPKNYIVQEIVRGCKGSPLAIEVVSGSLRNQPSAVWLNRMEVLKSHSILESDKQFQKFIQDYLDKVLEEMPTIKDCFMDLGLFPVDESISVAALIDMWAELHKPDENGTNAVNIVNELVTRNLANMVWSRDSLLLGENVASDSDGYMYYNNNYVKLHGHLRDLAIYLSNLGAFEQRKRLIIDINGENRPEWWIDEKQQGIISHIVSLIPKWLMEQKQQQVVARTLSITTDETFTSDWCSLLPDEAEVLVLNVYSVKYTFPEFLKKMRKLKVLIATNFGSYPSELNKFELLGSLSDLKRVRLEKASVPYLCKLKNLQKLSLCMCKVNEAFQSSIIQISEALPNMVEISIDYCSDLVELPAGFCHIKPLKKVNITNCHRFSALPQDIGMLENLEVLRLSSCTDLEEMPASITMLSKLRFLDISHCIKLRRLPENMGELRNLRKICMTMGAYSRLCELPNSVVDLAELEHVVCDKEMAALWEDLCDSNLNIEVPNLNWVYAGPWSYA